MTSALNLALIVAFVFAIVASFVTWIANLNVAASASDQTTGVVPLRVVWGIFLALVLLKLMTLR